MYKISYYLIVLILVITSCNNRSTHKGKFSSSDKILKMETIKHKGCGLFEPSAGALYFQNPNENHFELDFILPQGIDSIKIASQMLDIKPVIYRNFKKNRDTVSFNYSAKKFNIDTISFPKHEIKQNYLSILKGTMRDSTILIVDQNNNRDFSDDTLRAIKPMEWRSLQSLIGFTYEIFNGSKIVKANSWINIGQSNRNYNLLCFVSQYVSTTFSIENKTYTIAVSDGQWNCSFDEISIALVEENGIKKDSLKTQDYLKNGEYLKLGSQYYKFENIANDGSIITLIKVDDFESKIGTQIGMIAPDFKSHTIQGETVSLKDNKGSYLLLANISACWSPISSYKSYKDLTNKYSEKIKLLAIDNSLTFLKQNIIDLKLKGKFIIAEDNISIQENYRPDYYSRTCFLINPTGRIVDKFEIFDWERSLADYFTRNDYRTKTTFYNRVDGQ